MSVALAGCSGGGSEGKGSDHSPEPTKPVTPADVIAPVTAAAQAAKSVVVTRTEQGADGKDVTQEEIETSFAEPVSARVLHVGEEIWTLNVVDGEGFLKDQTEQKSTNRWARLDKAETAERLEHATLTGLLAVLEGATSVTETATGKVRGVDATCHTFSLADGSSETARLCVDPQKRPIELIAGDGDVTTTSVFTGWGTPVDAIAPPASLVD